MKIDDYRLLITLDETKTLRKAAEIYIFSTCSYSTFKGN